MHCVFDFQSSQITIHKGVHIYFLLSRFIHVYSFLLLPHTSNELLSFPLTVITRMPFSRRPTACLFEISTENSHQISLTLLKVEVWGLRRIFFFFFFFLGGALGAIPPPPPPPTGAMLAPLSGKLMGYYLAIQYFGAGTMRPLTRPKLELHVVICNHKHTNCS